MEKLKLILAVVGAVLFATGAAAQGAHPGVEMIPGVPTWLATLVQGGLSVYLVIWFTTRGYPQFLAQIEAQQKQWREERRQDTLDHTAALRELYAELKHGDDK